MSPSLRSLAHPSATGAVLALTGVIALLYYGRLFLITLIIAVILSMLLEPLVQLMVRVKLPRPLASFLTCALAGLVLYLVGFGFYSQAANFVEDLPNYQKRISEIVNNVADKLDTAERAAYDVLVPRRVAGERAGQQQTRQSDLTRSRRRRALEPAPATPATPPPVPEVRIRPDRPPLVDFFYSHLGSVYEVLLMSSFIPFLVYFMLSWRNHIYRGFLMLFEDEDRVVATKTLDGIGIMVRAFVVGNFVLGTILAAASTVAFLLLGLPYSFLIGPTSGLLSLVPYVGLPLAMIPPFLAALVVSSALTPYLVSGIVVALLHLLALNLLYPKIVGQRVHLNPLVVTVAIMLWSTLWGAAGFLLAIPLTAGIKAVCDNVPKLNAYGKLLGD
jgi:predicted PurR-regulated permease PerM